MSIQYVRDAGVAPGANGYFDTPDLSPTNLTMKNVGTVAAVLTLVDMLGAKSEPITIAPNAPLLIENMSLHQYSLTGNGALVVMYAGWPEKVNPDYISLGTTGGVSTTPIGTSLLAAGTSLYTCPAGTRAHLVRVRAVTTHFPQTVNLWVSPYLNGTTGEQFPITPAGGIAMVSGAPLNGNWTAGPEPFNNATLPGDGLLLLPGDQVLGTSSVDNQVAAYLVVLQEPL